MVENGDKWRIGPSRLCGSHGVTGEDCHMADVDAANDNGFFARWGEPAPQRLGSLAGTHMSNGVQVR